MTIVTAELKSVLSGLSLCCLSNIQNVVVKSDLELVVKWLGGRCCFVLKYNNKWCDIFQFYEVIACGSQHLYRDGNKIYDRLTKQGAEGRIYTLVSEADLPRDIQSLCVLDREEIPNFRFFRSIQESDV